MTTLFITGGYGDIGQAITKEFRDQGYQVLAPRSSELDLSSLDYIEAFVTDLPEITSFIHCAGINNPVTFDALSLENIERTLTINALAFYKIMQCLSLQNKLQENGHVLALSSIYGEISRKGRFAYTAAKYCLNGMIKNLALELGSKRIKVNGLAPGFVDTKLTRKNNSPEQIASLEQAIPLGFMAQAEDIAKAAFFLATSVNRYISGQTIFADGGYLSGGFQA